MCRAILVSVVVFTVSVFGVSQNSSARHFNNACGQVFTQKQFIIESPLYPSNYPLNYQCSYLVKGPSCPTYFTLQFLDFNIEYSLGCSKDRLEIDDKDALCGSRNDIRQYFSDKGTLIIRFVSDNDGTGRGYRILITRMPCQNPETTTRYVPKWHTTNNDVEYTTTIRPHTVNRDFSKCCQTSYGAKQFTLISPNYPYSMSSPTECVYEIYRRNSNVCRLRIHAHFLWLGRYSNDCPEGFLEIDGKYICGCKTDLKLTLSFEGAPSKILRFVSRGYERNSYSGFVLEVVQDECPKKYVPEEPVKNEEMFRFYNDQINRVAWPNATHKAMIDKLKHISENTEVLEDKENERKPKVVRHVYFFAEQDHSRVPRDREEVDYVDTSALSSSVVQDQYGYNYCLEWNRQQFSFLNTRRLPTCKSNEGNVIDKKCVEMNHLRGYFKSPGYPFYYPGNLNICYRFKKLPGYCSIRLYMKHFHLENSPNCVKDYLLFPNQLRYCGSQISNTISTLDLRNKPHEDVYFVTDDFYCGKGFFGVYEQIACQNIPTPTPAPTTRSPLVPCNRVIREAMFSIEVYDYNDYVCTFSIRKNSPDVCAVTLYFEKFDLACVSESLLVDGTMYCGRLTGQSVRVELKDTDAVIIYRKSSTVGGSGLRLKINGVQMSDNCPYPDVPAERLLSAKSLNLTALENRNKFLLKIEKNFKDVCGVVANTTETKLPERFCDFLMKHDNNVTECLPLRENSLKLPVESQKIELKIQNAEEIEEIEFEEVDCEKLSTLQ